MEQISQLNAVGGQIRKMRRTVGITQAMLVARCNLIGGEFSRGTLAKIEAQIRGVSDRELFVFAKVFGVTMEDLFPKGFTTKSMKPDQHLSQKESVP